MAVSSGAACSAISTSPSHVLTALGHSEKLAYASVRFGVGRFNTVDEINKVAEHFVSTVESLRKQAVMI